MQQSCNREKYALTAAAVGGEGVVMWRKDWADRFGSVASTLCALHCALCAFLPVVFTVAGVGFLLSERAEWAFSIVAILFGLGALGLGWRQHRSKQIAALFIVGVFGILASRGLEMGSHHGHGDDHHEVQEHAEATEDHGAEKHHDDHAAEGDDHHDDHADGEDSMHLIGAAVGVAAGFILLMGHILNIRTARRYREED